MKTIYAFLLLALSLHAQYPGAKPVPERLAPGFKDIQEKDCRAWLGYLASDKLRGRKTGSEGHRMAADFIAARFKEFGLKPIGDQGTFFQKVTLYRFQGQDLRGTLKVGGRTWTNSHGLVPHLSVGRVSGPVIFIASGSKKRGLKKPERLRDHVLVLNATANVTLSPLYRQIGRNRPRAIILLRRTYSPLPPVQPRRLMQKWQADIPLISVPAELAAPLLKELGIKSSWSQKPQKNVFKVIEAKKEMEAQVEAKHEVVEAPNVIGMLEGRDPALKHEVVICGSHLDHIGVTPDGRINNGADDDGSGSTALIAVARAFARSPEKPRRSLVFIAVCGEEDGLLGSEYYVENPIIPIKDTVCELQMDMIGRNEESPGKDRPEDNVRTTHLIGSKKLSMDLHRLIIAMNRYVGFEFEYDQESVYYRSDHYNFARKGIPISFFFSGFHPDYHKPTDTIEKINFEKLANTAKLVYLTAFTAADRTKRIVVDKKKKKRRR